MWSIVYYITENGRCPVKEYLKELGGNDEALVRADIDLLKQFGLELKQPHVKPIDKKIYELRTAGDRKQHRVLYFAVSGKKFVLLHAFTKKTQQTPQSEINPGYCIRN